MQRSTQALAVMALAWMMIAGVALAAAPAAQDIDATVGVVVDAGFETGFEPGAESSVRIEAKASEASAEIAGCAGAGVDLGLPVDRMTSEVVPSCPVDGTFCFDADLCRAQCRTCGIELGACVFGLCRCFDH